MSILQNFFWITCKSPFRKCVESMKRHSEIGKKQKRNEDFSSLSLEAGDPYGPVYEPFYAGFKETSFIKLLSKSICGSVASVSYQ